MNLSNPNHLPKVLYPNIITVRILVSTYEFGEGHIQSITQTDDPLLQPGVYQCWVHNVFFVCPLVLNPGVRNGDYFSMGRWWSVADPNRRYKLL